MGGSKAPSSTYSELPRRPWCQHHNRRRAQQDRPNTTKTKKNTSRIHWILVVSKYNKVPYKCNTYLLIPFSSLLSILSFHQIQMILRTALLSALICAGTIDGMYVFQCLRAVTINEMEKEWTCQSTEYCIHKNFGWMMCTRVLIHSFVFCNAFKDSPLYRRKILKHEISRTHTWQNSRKLCISTTNSFHSQQL